MFCKLNLTKKLPITEPKELLWQYGKERIGIFWGMKYWAIQENIDKEIRSILPEEYRKYFETSIFKINIPYIPVHIDNEIITSINFYVQTVGAKTHFYRYKNPNMNVEKLPNHSDGCLYKESDMERTDTFIAKPGEVWLLNVKVPHSVRSKSFRKRIAYCLQSRHISYEETKQILNKNGLI
jgi:hypothetical protein